jgi:hypothetical protein
MLRRCLTAIAKLAWLEGTVSIIVVDNENEPNNRALAEEFGAPMCTSRGIANARNAAVEAALALGPDFVAFTNYVCEPPNYLSLKSPLKRLIEAVEEFSESENGVELSRTPHPGLPPLCVRPLKPRLCESSATLRAVT